LSGGDSSCFLEEKYWCDEACSRRPINHNDKDNSNITLKLICKNVRRGSNLLQIEATYKAEIFKNCRIPEHKIY
jgi:hypothetical protein